jgi:hypothetical protein
MEDWSSGFWTIICPPFFIADGFAAWIEIMFGSCKSRRNIGMVRVKSKHRNMRFDFF